MSQRFTFFIGCIAGLILYALATAVGYPPTADLPTVVIGTGTIVAFWFGTANAPHT